MIEYTWMVLLCMVKYCFAVRNKQWWKEWWERKEDRMNLLYRWHGWNETTRWKRSETILFFFFLLISWMGSSIGVVLDVSCDYSTEVNWFGVLSLSISVPCVCGVFAAVLTRITCAVHVTPIHQRHVSNVIRISFFSAILITLSMDNVLTFAKYN